MAVMKTVMLWKLSHQGMDFDIRWYVVMNVDDVKLSLYIQRLLQHGSCHMNKLGVTTLWTVSGELFEVIILWK